MNAVELIQEISSNGRAFQDLAFQVLKYNNRDGYSQRDIYRLAHPNSFVTATDARKMLYDYISKEAITK